MKNKAVAALPKHLLQFAVDQRYDEYTPVDHAVWRFIMRQNTFFLREYAHKLYFQGLLDTGISFDRIPRIEEMNEILGKIGWGGVAVDGFIPPAAFMEFQAYRVLVIACDMRQINHIEYTPAPDIVHDPAGHAPIIVDQEYATDLRALARSARRQCLRRKASSALRSDPASLDLERAAESGRRGAGESDEARGGAAKESGRPFRDGAALAAPLVDGGIRSDRSARQTENLWGGRALLNRRIGELSRTQCEENPYSIGAILPFDIPTSSHSFCHARFSAAGRGAGRVRRARWRSVSAVLRELRSQSECKKGGGNTATCEYSSGLQVSSGFTEVITARRRRDLSAHDWRQRARVQGTRNFPGTVAIITRKVLARRSAIGKRRISHRKTLTDEELTSLGIATGKDSTVEFASGVLVKGRVENILRRDGKLLLITFTNSGVRLGDRVLFEPAWGNFDMAVGARIASVFNGAADKDAYNPDRVSSARATIKRHIGRETHRGWKVSTRRSAIFANARLNCRTSGRNLRNAAEGACRRLAPLDGDFSRSSMRPASRTRSNSMS